MNPSNENSKMSSLFAVTSSFCGTNVDKDDDDEIDFCGMPSQKIVEIAIQREFLLLRLQDLVDAQNLSDAEAALVDMERQARKNSNLLRFLVRAGTVEIIRGNKILMEVGATPRRDNFEKSVPPVFRSKAANSLMRKLQPYYEQRRLIELKKRRSIWAATIIGWR